MKDRICVTGIGIISAIGSNRFETLESLLTEKSGISRMRHLKSIHKDIPVGGVRMSDKELKISCGIEEDYNIARTTLLGIIAAREACAHA